MSVQLKDLTVKVTKEVDDVMLLLLAAVKTVRDGQPVANLVGDLVKAIDGVKEVPAEASEATFECLASVTNRSLEIAKALLAPKKVPAVA